ncbi:MAG: TagF domain-containing protein [Alysiella sp.]|nr:TagF domain-containing protein [Alysiella sp.]MDO4433995.1 TagF domain-containing protein [Alysiella sp.]
MGQFADTPNHQGECDEPHRKCLFFGKLKTHRDFIQSTDLSLEDKNFWQTWFQKCANTQLHFTGKVKNNHSVWLFVIATENGFMYGLISPSQDMQGRFCPFVVCAKTHSPDCLRLGLQRFFQIAFDFAKYVKQGVFLISNLINECDSHPKNQNDIVLPETFSLERISQNGSLWFECNNKQAIESANVLSCFLFNKLFG